MNTVDVIAAMLDMPTGEAIAANRENIAEIRLRMNQPVRMISIGGKEISGSILNKSQMQRIMNRLMENSLYAREEELKQGYFTAMDGARVGVCGKINAGRNGIEALANIGSACVRIPREVIGCAEAVFAQTLGAGKCSVLILSAPGLGKTTLLRDFARLASDSGMNVAVADERREIAACMEGIPGLDVGSRTDVMDACPKAIALPMLIRACAPDVLIVDEIGSAPDAAAIRDAICCGVSIVASAHASSIEEALDRTNIGDILREGIFDWCVLMGPERGRIDHIIPMRKCADERL